MRTKGAKGKVGKTAKDNIIAVFDLLGGRRQMAKWAGENQTEYYKLYAKLIPLEQHVTGELGHYQAIPVEQRDDIPGYPVASPEGSAVNGNPTSHH